VPEEENTSVPADCGNGSKQNSKRHYDRPRLTDLGTLKDLTKGAPAAPGDDGFDGGVATS